MIKAHDMSRRKFVAHESAHFVLAPRTSELMALRSLAVILVLAHAVDAENVTSRTDNMTKGQVRLSKLNVIIVNGGLKP